MRARKFKQVHTHTVNPEQSGNRRAQRSPQKAKLRPSHPSSQVCPPYVAMTGRGLGEIIEFGDCG